MGSQSDWPIMKHAVEQLEAFGMAYEAKIVSAHRTPELLYEFATSDAVIRSLKEIGVDNAQGYAVARPVPLAFISPETFKSVLTTVKK